MKIIVATGNSSKVRELKEILDLPDIEILSMKEAGYNSDPIEDGETFEENALIKARALMDLIKKDNLGNISIGDLCVIADDSGICVDYLDGMPGIYSARYAGDQATDADRNTKLLKELDGVQEDDRSAKFVCAAVAVFGNGQELVVRGEWHGIIAQESSGENGFGYDPIFYVPELGMTSACLSDEEKNAVSHRGKAFEKLSNMIINMGNGVSE